MIYLSNIVFGILFDALINALLKLLIILFKSFSDFSKSEKDVYTSSRKLFYKYKYEHSFKQLRLKYIFN